MPRVYQFKVWNIRAGTYRVSRKIATAESVGRARGVIIEGTEAEAPAELYTPLPTIGRGFGWA
jgi:hypothetical protein